MAALAWETVPKDGWRVSWQWTLASAIVGILAGFTFRYLIDKPAYVKADAMGSFGAPTSPLHDFGAYPVLFGGLFCIGVPLFVRIKSGVRSSGLKPKTLPFHPGTTGEGKVGRVKSFEPSVDASSSGALAPTQ